jgi:Nucleoside-diphosphate-sugar pyrophosphorylase involved in lipopolysaccharide biosynthesis/translation initiation factor 2B, gamma/epsilon subunits (eIF-2Bgamma/eIF-2Bepsilon)
MPMVSPTGLILAGGYGKRLKPLTDTLPKPLIELKEGYCILDKQLNDLRFAGSNEVVLMTGYLHDKIEKKYGNEWKGLRIRYSVEDRPLGTWGAIKKAIQELDLKGPLAIMNGDIITDVDIASMFNNGSHAVTILGVQMRSPYGTLDISGTTIVSFREKPVLPYYINGGVYFVKEAKELLSAGADLSPPSSIENDVFPRLARAGKLGVYIEPDTDVLWKSLDSIKDLEEVRNIYQNRTDKPWGFELVVALTEKYLQKKLYIKEGYRTSMHYHEYKMETLYVVKGKVRVEFPDSKAIELNEGERHTIEPKTVHSIVALRNTYIDEASSPHPSDTIRVKDYYLR